MTFVIVTFLVIGTVAGSLTGKPLLLTAVRSESMYPTLTRGDLVLLWPISRRTELRVGDIAVFKVDEGSLRSAGWVIHRIVAGDATAGFETQGDNNATSDQHRDANRRIFPADIAARAVTAGGTPLHLPLAGHIPLLAESVLNKPTVLAGVALLVLVLAFLPQPVRRRQRQHRSRHGSLLAIYGLGGACVLAFFAAAGLMLSEQYVYTYAVSDESRAALLGSSVGQLLIGDEVEQPLSTIENSGKLPLTMIINSSDPHVTVSPDRAVIAAGTRLDLTVRVEAREIGMHRARITVGLFYPVLPAAIIQGLGARSYWLALAAAALVMALPIFALPLLDRTLREQLLQALRRGLSRLPR